MTEPDTPPAPASRTTEEELRVAALQLLGDSQDRTVEHRTGLSKTTINDLRNQRRRLTTKTLTSIVDAYDPAHRDEWLEAWRRVRPPATRSVPASAADSGDSGDDARADEHGGPTLRAVRGGSGSPRRPLVSLTVAFALGAGVLAVMDHLVLDGSGAAARPLAAAAASAAVRAAPGAGPDQPPPAGPAGPGAAGPVGGFGPPRGDLSPSADASPTTFSGCYTMPLRTTAQVVAGPDAAPAGVRLTSASYTYYATWHPALAVGARLDGRIPSGQRLVAAGWADPATRDSTRAHNTGNGLFYPGDELALSAQNCFTVLPYSLGYGGYSGITTRVYLLLEDASEVLGLQRQAGQLGGFTSTDLASWGIRIVGYVVVPTPAG